jgi:hypothetical protein
MSDWIPLKVHPEHPKVLLLARLSAKGADHVFACIVRWFRWVDEHADQENTGLDAAAMERIVGWEGRAGALVASMRHERVGWLTESPLGEMVVPEFERNFGRSARRRYLDNSRKANTRKPSADVPQNVRIKSGQKADTCPQNVRTPCGTSGGQNVEPQQQQQVQEEKPVQTNCASAITPPPEGRRAAPRLGWTGQGEGPDPESQGSCVAVLRLLESLGVGEPCLSLIVAARRFTPAAIESAWVGVQQDPDVKHPLRALVARLKERAGIAKSADRLSEADQAWVREIQALRRKAVVGERRRA